jgi:hypothetical protein
MTAAVVIGGSGWFRSPAITADYHAVPQGGLRRPATDEEPVHVWWAG